MGPSFSSINDDSIVQCRDGQMWNVLLRYWHTVKDLKISAILLIMSILQLIITGKQNKQGSEIVYIDKLFLRPNQYCLKVLLGLVSWPTTSTIAFFYFLTMPSSWPSPKRLPWILPIQLFLVNVYLWLHLLGLSYSLKGFSPIYCLSRGNIIVCFQHGSLVP